MKLLAAAFCASLATTSLPAAQSAVPARELLRTTGFPGIATFLPGRTSPPVVGQTWDPVLVLGLLPGADRALVLVSAEPANHPLGAPGLLLCAPPFHVLAAGVPGEPFAVPIPLDVSLVGRRFCTQGVARAPGEVLVLANNAIDITIGDTGVVASLYLLSASLGCTSPGFGAPFTCATTTLALGEELRLTFNAPLDLASVDVNTVQLVNVANGSSPPATFRADPGDPRTLVIQASFQPAATYQLLVRGVNQDLAPPFLRSTAGAANEDRLLATFVVL